MAIDWDAYEKKRKLSQSVGVASSGIDWDSYAKSKGLTEPIKQEEQQVNMVQEEPFQPETPRKIGLITLPSVTTEGMTPLQANFPEAKGLDWIGGALNAIINVPSAAVTGYLNSLSNVTQLRKEDTTAKKVGKVMEAGLGAINMIPAWLAFSTGLEAAKNVPVLGVVPKAIGKGLELVGKAGGYVGGKAIDIAPISDEAKIELRQPFEELSAVATQILVAHGTGKVIPKGVKLMEEVKVKVEEKLDAKIREVQATNMVINPTIARAIANSVIKDIGRADYTKRIAEAERRPVPKRQASPFVVKKTSDILDTLDRVNKDTVSKSFIQDMIDRKDTPKVAAKELQSVLDTFTDKVNKAEFQAKVRESVMGDVKPAEPTVVEPIKTELPTVAEIPPIVNEPISVRPVREISELKEITPKEVIEASPEAETAPSKPSVELVDKAVERAAMRDRIELPETERLNMKESEEIIKKLMTDDIEGAMDVAMGHKEAPKGSQSSMIWKAMAEYAVANRDAKMVADLAVKSSVPREGTESGRFIKGFDYGESRTNAVDIIVKITKKRAKESKKKYDKKAESAIKNKEKLEMDKEINKADKPMKKTDWETFLSEIVCK
ncbi:MAG: hypothetical protein M0R06_01955 [Sphaerochaeta sp.]|jgi:hypothetical protein|nr:hypothetical protein [Sphaerochaeta sp.]